MTNKSVFLRKKKTRNRMAEYYIKNFISVTILGNSNNAIISKNGRKILIVGDNHVKQIRSW